MRKEEVPAKRPGSLQNRSIPQCDGSVGNMGLFPTHRTPEHLMLHRMYCTTRCLAFTSFVVPNFPLMAAPNDMYDALFYALAAQPDRGGQYVSETPQKIGNSRLKRNDRIPPIHLRTPQRHAPLLSLLLCPDLLPSPPRRNEDSITCGCGRLLPRVSYTHRALVKD